MKIEKLMRDVEILDNGDDYREFQIYKSDGIAYQQSENRITLLIKKLTDVSLR